MPPKIKGVAVNKGPVVIQRGTRIKLQDLSCDPTSGHRDVDPDRVRELKAEFRDGKYKQTLLGAPSIVKGELDTNGKTLLQDGKATVKALQDCLKWICSKWICSKWGAILNTLERNIQRK